LVREITRPPPVVCGCCAGTGAGILAIAAAKLGASHVDAFDLDPTAVRTARQNAKLNELETSIHFWKQDLLSFVPKLSYEIVTANLYSELLRQSAARLVCALVPTGHLIVSGLMRDQVEPIRKLLEAKRTPILILRARGKWVTLLAQKAQ
jgi:ribosomal protein L11 methyltransferase